jgi:hypothetical protein
MQEKITWEEVIIQQLLLSHCGIFFLQDFYVEIKREIQILWDDIFSREMFRSSLYIDSFYPKSLQMHQDLYEPRTRQIQENTQRPTSLL